MRPWRAIVFFIAAMSFALVANVCAFFVFSRMRSIGFSVGLWRTMPKDLFLYRGYWNIAPKRNWSRAPIIIGALCFVVAIMFLLLAVFSKATRG
jgi:hypothetical protein